MGRDVCRALEASVGPLRLSVLRVVQRQLVHVELVRHGCDCEMIKARSKDAE